MKTSASLRIEFCGIELSSPVINGSGTYDAIASRRIFGDEAFESKTFPFAAFVSKTITLEPRRGNPPPRLYETPAGMINSIGLPGPGVDGYLEHDLPELARLGVPLFTNVMGSSADEVGELFDRVDSEAQIAAIELNVSCPNVKTGLDIGSDPGELAGLLGAVRPRLSKPLIVKLTPNVTDVAEIARAAESAGADAVSLVNTLRAWAPHPERPAEPWLGAVRGGLSGPAIRPVTPWSLASLRIVNDRSFRPVVAATAATA
jgi:dihydroorotate dehydrogenase (NAD+) catalytic subunit